jgi:uncharacterized protein (TIGR00290 family)
MGPIKNKTFFCSWSGGKDSCLALYRSLQNGGKAEALLTMMVEDGQRSRSHGLSRTIIAAQADALGIPGIVKATSWQNYEQTFLSTLKDLKTNNFEYGVFGDIDLEDHLKWVENVCTSAGLQAYEPLWQTPRRNLLDEFLELGFRATIIAVRQDLLSQELLGRTLDWEVIAELEDAGVDASGEEGEYHTVVTDGPIFFKGVKIVQKDRVFKNGYCFLDMEAGPAIFSRASRLPSTGKPMERRCLAVVAEYRALPGSNPGAAAGARSMWPRVCSKAVSLIHALVHKAINPEGLGAGLPNQN